MSQSIKLSLVICTFRRPIPVSHLLNSLEQQFRMPDETLIIDASPDQETAEVVESFQKRNGLPGLHYFNVPPEQRGLTRQRNYGVARVSGEIVAFLDDDTIPEPQYFAELLACFARHPQAAGISGYITNEVQWQRGGTTQDAALKVFNWGEWTRRESQRNQLRKLFKLDSPLPPGWMPACGHGRASSYPPDGQDYQVEYLMGGVSAWRRDVFAHHRFSHFFEGYGLYEDLDFCLRVARQAPLFLCTRARIAHYHAAAGRPNQFHYGLMVVRNGWFVWRRRWPQPVLKDKFKWWAVTMLLTLCRLGDAIRGPQRQAALTEMFGRLWGAARLLWDAPSTQTHD